MLYNASDNNPYTIIFKANLKVNLKESSKFFLKI